jgi:hypothetical protein
VLAQLDRDAVIARPGRALARLAAYFLFEGRPVTTRGRWINPLVRRWLEVAARVSSRREVAAPIIVVGQGRSGTTILGKILALHKEVGFLNEPKLLWSLVDPRFDVHGEYSGGVGSYRLPSASLASGARDRASGMYQAFCALSGSARVCDKYLDLLYRAGAVKALFPAARFVFIVRHGNDVSRSVERWNREHGMRSGTDRHDWWGVNGAKWNCLVRDLVPDLLPAGAAEEARALEDDRGRATVEWMLAAIEGKRLVERFPESVRAFRYEDLVGAPRKVLTSLFSFCGLSADEAPLRYAEARLGPRPTSEPPDLPREVAELYVRLLAENRYSLHGQR